VSKLDNQLGHSVYCGVWEAHINAPCTCDLDAARTELAALRHELDAAKTLLWIATHSYPNPARLEFDDGECEVAVCGYGDTEVTYIKCEMDEPYGTPSLSTDALAQLKPLLTDEDGDVRYWDERIDGPYDTNELAALRRRAEDAEAMLRWALTDVIDYSRVNMSNNKGKVVVNRPDAADGYPRHPIYLDIDPTTGLPVLTDEAREALM